MITKEEIQKLYVDEKKSTITIGKQLGVSHNCIMKWMDKYGIKRRTLIEASPKIRPWNKGKQPRLGKTHSEETKAKLRAFHTGSHLSQETKDKMKAYRNTPEYKSLQSKSQTKVREMWADPEYRAKQTPILSAINKRHWKNPEYRNKVTKAAMLGSHIKPNKPEVFIQSLLDKMYPNNYKYTGDGGVVIGGKCPDFYNEENKRVILFHGIYWHLWKYQKTNPNLTKEQVEQEDINHYRKYGYDILIIWEDEMADTNSMLAKIMSFHNKVVIGEKPIAIFEAEIASGVLPKIGGD